MASNPIRAGGRDFRARRGGSDQVRPTRAQAQARSQVPLNHGPASNPVPPSNPIFDTTKTGAAAILNPSVNQPDSGFAAWKSFYNNYQQPPQPTPAPATFSYAPSQPVSNGAHDGARSPRHDVDMRDATPPREDQQMALILEAGLQQLSQHFSHQQGEIQSVIQAIFTQVVALSNDPNVHMTQLALQDGLDRIGGELGRLSANELAVRNHLEGLHSIVQQILSREDTTRKDRNKQVMRADQQGLDHKQLSQNFDKLVGFVNTRFATTDQVIKAKPVWTWYSIAVVTLLLVIMTLLGLILARLFGRI